MRIKTCIMCESEFKTHGRRDKTGKFCSVLCKANYQRESLMQNHPHWKGGEIINVHGYVLVRRNKRYEYKHRISAEEKIIKRKLNKNEVVHHIDGNKANNNVKNLIVMIKKDHDKKHTVERWDAQKESGKKGILR